MDLGPADTAEIGATAPIVSAFAERGVDMFFEHLARFPSTRALFERPGVLARARALKLAHLEAMTAGAYDLAYAEQRLELAALYSTVDLDARVFLGAFHHLMQAIGRRIMRVYQHDPETGFLRFMSLKKVAFFDIGLVVDALVLERERTIRLQQLALRSIGDGVIATDTEGRVTMTNPVAEALTGWNEASGAPIDAVYRTLDAVTREPSPSPVAAALGGVKTALRRPTIVVARDGAERMVVDSAAPIRAEDGAILGAVLVFHDVTEQLKIEVEMQRASTLESLGVLAGGIAHDFNNLLTGMLANVSIARVQASDPALVRSRLADAESAALRARELTQQLLTFATGGAPQRKRAVLGPLVHEWVRFALAGSNVRAVVRAAPGLWAVDVDVGQISQVVQNIVMNAQQATPEGGEILVTIANVDLAEGAAPPLPKGGYVRLDVLDSGSGIPAQLLTRIFDPFFTTKTKGTGLGLATALSIVQKHGGHVSVQSEVGRGTTVSVYLPAVDVEVAVEPAPTVAAPSRRAARVLVMDDDAMIRAAASEMLEFLGCAATTARDGAHAITLFQEALDAGAPFDLLILDLTVPGAMGGVQALAAIRAIAPDALAIVSSGYSADPTLAEYRDHGFADAIPKPYSLAELANALGRVLDPELAPTLAP